jgi:glycine hydroxymethyltransferase
VPQDPNGAWYTSGIRFGTPALTTRGFGHDEFDAVADMVVDVLSNTQPSTTSAGAPSKASYVLADGVAARTHARIDELLVRNPLYPGLELT